jgi:hypothetical protein
MIKSTLQITNHENNEITESEVFIFGENESINWSAMGIGITENLGEINGFTKDEL